MTVYHCTLRGTIASGSIGEIFSHSHGIESTSSASAVANAVHDAWATLWGTAATGLGTFFPTTVTYTEATAAQVIDPMVPDLGAAAHALFSPPLAGRSADPSLLPSQNALAVSVTAGVRPNGKPFRGRFYLPPINASAIDVDGLLPSATTASVATLFRDYLNTLSTAGHYPSIWSRTVEDLVQPITQVRIGNRVDTIRSRRNRYPEVYSVEPVTGPG